MLCPQCHTSSSVIKAGLRHTQKGIIQRYYCKQCRCYFSDTAQPYTQYPLPVILYAIEQYTRGYPVKEVKKKTGKTYRYSPPIQTIYSWLERYKDILTFIKTRKRYAIDPETVIQTHRFHHQQMYPFSYHTLKLNLYSKHLPQLRRYINWVERSLSNTMFLKGPRASSLKIKNTMQPLQQSNIIPTLTTYALATKKKTMDAHELVERFFLLHDATTICTELPVFLNPDEIKSIDVDGPLTGHIDIVQIRFNTLYILDYKPNLRHPDNYGSQLFLYREALHKRTSIPKEKIVPAVFNHEYYYEFTEAA